MATGGNAALEKALEAQMVKAAQAIEERLDSEIGRLESMNDDDLEQLREKRLRQMKEQARMKDEWIANGHGRYFEVASEKEFFEESKRSKNMVCHFFKDSTFRCKIVDKHLELLAPKHVECKFIKLNVEKAPFLTQRLGIRVIPTICLVRDSKTKDYIVGFDDLGGHDEFSTEMLEWRIARSEVIQYSGDLMRPPDESRAPGPSSILGASKKSKTIRGRGDESSDDDDW